MTKEQILKKLDGKFVVVSEESKPNGIQLKFNNGTIVNCFTNGNHNLQGKNTQGQIRLSNDWAVQDKLNQKIVVEREVSFKEIRNSWIQRLYQLVGSKQGKVKKLFSNKTGGFIQADKPYYFQFKKKKRLAI